MNQASPQRSYRAPCPGCGAPVSFSSAQSTHAVCAYCQSMVLRQGETLSRLGKMAELFDDHSPLQLQASGVWNKQAFTLVGRLQYKYGEGSWNEWHALLADGSSAYLSEDNGAYVFGLPMASPSQTPAAGQWRVGSTVTLAGQPFSVSTSQQVALISAQGELPHLPTLGQSFAMVELRSQGRAPGATDSIIGSALRGEAAGDAAEVISIDYSQSPAVWSRGAAVLLDELALTGLRDEIAKEELGRQFSCPSCGAPLAPLLPSSKSLCCGSCNSIIDLSQGLGGELKAALQGEPVQPLIALGARGNLQGTNWQVVGFQHRLGTDPSDPDEHFGWDEYLLYQRERGFIFLVDSSDGWSVVKPVTGAPQLAQGGRQASYLGTHYKLKESYRAVTSYVAGEFYWRVERGQTTENSDFASGKSLLSREQGADEVTWSVGSQIDSEAVAKAFALQDKAALLKRSDAAPASAAQNVGCGTVIVLAVIMLVLLLLISRCSSCDPKVENCTTSRSSGGSFGGFSSGGGHK